MSRRRTARSGLALAASVALHLALVGLLLRWIVPPSPGPAGGAAPMEVELQPREPRAAVPPGQATAQPAPRRVPGAARAESGGPMRPGSLSFVPGVPDSAGAVGAGGVGAGSWDLRPRLPGGAPGWFGAPGPTPQQALDREVSTVMDGLRAEDLARYPDASWTGLRDALAAGFLAPERALEMAEKATGTGGGGPNGLGRFAQAYGDMLGQYGRTGTTLPRDVEAPGDHDSPRAFERQVAAAGAAGSPERAALATAIDGLDAQGPSVPTVRFGGLVAVVAVRLDARGAVAASRLVAASGNAEYDRAALEQARRLGGRELSRRLASTETEWAFVTEVRMRPPNAGAAVRFDATLKSADVAYPFQKLVRTRVELRAVRRTAG
ncbi:MAG: hypothetical protein QM704_22520 [Anaeromyxobacteraceae bacterium]